MIVDYGDGSRDRLEIIYTDEQHEHLDEMSTPSEEPSEVKILNNYTSVQYAPLTEIAVDPEYILEMVHPKHLEVLSRLRARYGKRGYEPIPYYDLSAYMFTLNQDTSLNYALGRKRINDVLRYLWRAGYLRRFVKGRVTWKVKKGRGEWYGVHYSLYPKQEE